MRPEPKQSLFTWKQKSRIRKHKKEIKKIRRSTTALLLLIHTNANLILLLKHQRRLFQPAHLCMGKSCFTPQTLA